MVHLIERSPARTARRTRARNPNLLNRLRLSPRLERHAVEVGAHDLPHLEVLAARGLGGNALKRPGVGGVAGERLRRRRFGQAGSGKRPA